MRLVALEVIPARCILKNGVGPRRAQALRILLRLEPFVGPGARHLGPAKLVFDVIEARLCRIEARLAQVIRQQHVVALVLTGARPRTRLVRLLTLIEQAEGGRLFVNRRVDRGVGSLVLGCAHGGPRRVRSLLEPVL